MIDIYILGLTNEKLCLRLGLTGNLHAGSQGFDFRVAPVLVFGIFFEIGFVYMIFTIFSPFLLINSATIGNYLLLL